MGALSVTLVHAQHQNVMLDQVGARFLSIVVTKNMHYFLMSR